MPEMNIELCGVDLRELIKAHFDAMHTTLWGVAFDITDPKRRYLAEAFLYEQIVELVERGQRIAGWRDAQDADTSEGMGV